MAVPRLSASLPLAAQELAALLRGLLAHEREIVADFPLYLGEFERRGGALRLGYGSLFDYCTRGLGLSSSAAFRRITASRLRRRFPAVESMLRDGRQSVTTLTLLKDVLDERNHRDLLARAAGLSKEQVTAFVAALRPKVAPRDSVRPLPPARLVALPAAALGPTAPSAAGTAARDDVPADAPAPALPPAAGPSSAPAVVVAVQPIPPPRVEPISAELRVLKVTVSRGFLADLEEVKAALSHTVPSGRFEDVVRECFRVVLARHRRRSESSRTASAAAVATATATPAGAIPVAAERAARTSAPARPASMPGRSAVPAALERQVRRRDGNRCAVRGPDGRICGSTHQLELHHRRSVARGGETTLENLLLVCRRHNDWLARLEFGEEHMARCRQRIATRGAARSAGDGDAVAARSAGDGDAAARGARGPGAATGGSAAEEAKSDGDGARAPPPSVLPR
jgi:hypothetical protein